jgi:hypothetical protein
VVIEGSPAPMRGNVRHWGKTKNCVAWRKTGAGGPKAMLKHSHRAIPRAYAVKRKPRRAFGLRVESSSYPHKLMTNINPKVLRKEKLWNGLDD